MLVRPAQNQYRTWVLDSRRWSQFRPRVDDIVIATYPKCGTTWMQQIVSLLVFQSAEPRPISQISVWLDRRFFHPIETDIAQIEKQQHRRFLKSHLPLDGLPLYDEVKYIHVARDGRDACMSFHNQALNFTEQMIATFDRIGLEDETIGRTYPRPIADPAAHFHRWITEGVVPGHQDGLPTMSFFHFEKSWWEARHRSNVLLVHYNALKADLPGEMQRIANFLGIYIAPSMWPILAHAAEFEAMRRDGDALMGATATAFTQGSRGFFFQGTNERWRGKFHDGDLALYDAKVEALLSPECALWVAQGQLLG